MKPLILVVAIAFLSVVATAQNSITAPPSWGHYKKLEKFRTSGLKGMDYDTLRFELPEGETRVQTIEAAVTGLIGHGREREPFYLTTTEKFNIPGPPANSSPQTRAELDYLLQLQSQRTEEDERASGFYAGVYYKTAVRPGDKDYAKFRRNLFHIGRSIGTWFHPDTLPLTAALVANAWKDAEYYIWKYKNYFLRIRPYKLETRLNNLEQTNWAAYPSGHATNSYVNAYLFSALLPEFSSFFLKDAYDMAHSREIIGVHYPSDSESGRLLAYQLVQKLMADKEFKKDFEAASAEIQNAKNLKGF